MKCDDVRVIINAPQPCMQEGDILGHESMGTVEQVGSEVKNIKLGTVLVLV